MYVNVKVTGIKELQKYMQRNQEQMRNRLPLTVKDTTLYLFNRIKESIAHGDNAPIAVDTGRFLNSVDFSKTGENSSSIFTDLEYAKFLEFGTSKMNARPHFRNTVFVNEKQIIEMFDREIKIIIDT